MKLVEIKEMAKQMGIRIGKMNKAEIIRAIQVQEKNNPCFSADVEFCEQDNCLWRGDCVNN